eukprot:CAMPEP_0201930848 /NCGR_PEP_ID=MMETSP0903-20130614/26038_1 /ASSEMBLY_ACC=CAM_ASM_000552 /TAXON_ID=420261 /ORGANISM="Thalassiosira antarctica, Strain CCMP982" /LENGTH=318 /DNA_ID=CAMNT_0048470019 /DNA_START=380 /DNA_END=1332 /DNA_ORIENTATION=+
MPAKVAPLMMMNAMPPNRAAAPPKPPPDPEKYSSFLGVLLEHLCCAQAEADSIDYNATAAHGGGSAAQVVGHQRHDTSQQQPSQQQRQGHRQQQPQRPPLNDSRRLSQPPTDSGNVSQRNNNQQQLDDSYDSSQRQDGRQSSNNPETIILPHLRFHPLPISSASAPAPSLQDFFDLFLADDAPHSFQLFHESNGDENVQVTPWKDVAARDENTADTNNINNSNENTERHGRMERTITFQTKITPGSSSNPLSSQSDQNHTNSNTNSTIIPLRVTILQSLLQLNERWILECEFSFDFHSPGDNNGMGGMGGSSVGKKLG